VNQDSLTIQCVTTKKGPIYMACICDGIGGLSEGEIASGFIVEELTKWFYQEVVPLQQRGKLSFFIGKSFYRKGYQIHEKLKAYGRQSGRTLGSTCTCLILYKKEYHIFHIGDTRVYRIGRRGKRLTEDHTVNAYTLAKCVGTGHWIKPDHVKGYYGRNDSFLLCSDGYRNQMPEKKMMDILKELNRKKMKEKDLKKGLEEIGKRNMKKGEKDNMSAIYVGLA